VEVGRPKRPASRSGAKSDALDAIRAAREALGQDRLATPRRRGEREALRVLLTTRRCATLARVAAIGQLKALIVGAPEELRAELRGRSTGRQVACCSSLRARPHKTLSNPYPTTPAMAANIADHVWTLEEIVNLLNVPPSN
jgi:transposase